MSIFDSITNPTADYLELGTFLICLAAALGCGVITAVAAAIRSRASRSFLVSLTLLPMIVATVIMMVNGEVGTGVAVMGAFSLIRFRSVPGKARDIVAIFLSMTAGLACSSGFVAIALAFTLLVSIVMVLLTLLPMGSDHCMELTITVPEALRFAGAFDDLFKKYLTTSRMVRARTTNMGSLYKLYYHVRMKDMKLVQEFIDELRCRNGNLEISMTDMLENTEEL